MKRADFLNSILILPLAYLLIFSLYWINKPLSLNIVEPGINIVHVLNQEMLREPDYKYLLDMQRLGLVPHRHVLAEFEEYFKLVTDSYPDQSDAYGMLGYCQYYLGEEDKAIQSYVSAIKINPDFMADDYNLAVIYYGQGEYAKAILFAKKALEVSLSAQVQSIVASNRIYSLMIMQIPGNGQQNIVERYFQLKQKALNLFKISTEQLNEPVPSQSREKLTQELI
jgi:tetratricopeptide (TPR) repeat protein